jgi:hypothetical protein
LAVRISVSAGIVPWVRADLRRGFDVDEERTAQHAVLAHQILDCAHFLLLALAAGLLGGEHKAGISRRKQQPGAAGVRGDHQPAAGRIMGIGHRLLRVG